MTASVDTLTMLADDEKKDIAVQILDALGIRVRTVNRHGEMVIPCEMVNYHNDQGKNPTAALNYKKMLFNCLGCQSSGSILWMVAQLKDLSGSDEALTWVKTLVGLGEVMDPSDLLRYIDGMYDRERVIEPIPTYSPQILLEWLMPNHAYFAGRDITLGQALKFQLGYQADTDRIVIPHYFDDRLVGWQTRTRTGRGEKYKNSPDFPKESTIFNYGRKIPVAVVVESNFTAIKHDNSLLHVESTIGAKVTDIQVGLLAKHEKVILWMDNDRAGWRATESLLDRLGPLTNVWCVDSPWHGDPDDLPSNEFRLQVTSAIPGALWEAPDPERLKKYERRDCN